MNAITQEYATPELTAGITADIILAAQSDTFAGYILNGGLLPSPGAFERVRGLTMVMCKLMSN